MATWPPPGENEVKCFLRGVHDVSEHNEGFVRHKFEIFPAKTSKTSQALAKMLAGFFIHSQVTTNHDRHPARSAAALRRLCRGRGHRLRLRHFGRGRVRLL